MTAPRRREHPHDPRGGPPRVGKGPKAGAWVPRRRAGRSGWTLPASAAKEGGSLAGWRGFIGPVALEPLVTI